MWEDAPQLFESELHDLVVRHLIQVGRETPRRHVHQHGVPGGLVQVQKVAAVIGGGPHRPQKVDVGPERVLEQEGDLQGRAEG